MYCQWRYFFSPDTIINIKVINKDRNNGINRSFKDRWLRVLMIFFNNFLYLTANLQVNPFSSCIPLRQSTILQFHNRDINIRKKTTLHRWLCPLCSRLPRLQKSLFRFQMFLKSSQRSPPVAPFKHPIRQYDIKRWKSWPISLLPQCNLRQRNIRFSGFFSSYPHRNQKILILQNSVNLVSRFAVHLSSTHRRFRTVEEYHRRSGK